LSNSGGKTVEVQFMSEVIDPDSDDHDYFWDFGDGSTSSAPNPQHIFLVSDNHPYTVFLKVLDDTQKWGWASCRVDVSQGVSSFPVTINFVGDIMLAREYEYPGGIIPTQGVEAIFEPTKSILGDAADFTVANLECPFTTYWVHHPTKAIYFKGSPENVAGLTFAGIDLVTLANNHTMDYMLPGMQETMEVLEENNILFSGSGENSYQAGLPAFYSKSGVNFAFLAASDRTGQYNNDQPYLDAGYNKPGFLNLTTFQIKKQISEVKGISDFVVMEFHSGSEYSFTPGKNEGSNLPFAGDFVAEEDYSPLLDAPTGWNREIRHFAIDNGADLVICHHPHIIHGVELYKGKLIAHSLGNFTFDLPYPETCPTFILNTKVDETGFYSFEIAPVYIDDFIPQKAKGELGLYILDYLARRSKSLDTYLKVDRENIVATVIMDTINMVTSETENIAELPLHLENGSYETPPFRFNKTGSISSINRIDPPGFFEYRLGRENIWFGNMENEGCTLWYLNNANEIYCDTSSYSGQRSLQHKREANSPYNLVTNLEQRIICPSDTLKFSLCGYIKTMNGSAVTIEVQYFQDQEGGVQLGEENIGTSINGDTPWTFYHQNLTIPAGTEFFDIRLVSGIPNSGTAFSWFDNVSLVCWENWTDPQIAASMPWPNDFYFLQIKSDQNPGEITVKYSETVFNESTVGMNNPENSTNPVFQLYQNSPNPFNPETVPTSIFFTIGQAGQVKIVVYDFMGRRVKVSSDAYFSEGKHHLYWDGKNMNGEIVNSGVYFYQLEFQNQKQVKKCVLLRF
jgi:poly-gamma-glutamate capsule biosynthesis protein CapA/YwtB (metallophosphatase superfamily)